ncbi:hypothetical protein AAX26_01793 [Aliarcobacter thereius]|uniref:hypothetical protein n=1 Tax=Aliarcobacter thereius TaxID=544718 RepID=UPI0008278CA2|nr:hypothetical protein [Aliarcobacter thereius]OCL85302.1 hypothetical protein AAX27_02158 [Aliarcobacter thereius]OCL85726.1 hypothetical protein AAX26_01793 [Aliarcobacter thereius]
MKPRQYGIYIPSDYYRELKFKKNNRAKARAFMEYYDDMDLGEHNSVRFYAKSWGIALGTAHGWIDDFKIEIDKYYATRQLRSDGHYNYAKKQNERNERNEMNKKETSNNDNNEYLNNISEQTEQTEMNKGLNASLYNNINADSNESTNQSLPKKDKKYSANFEILWNTYDKKSSNKARSQSIYFKRWKNTDIKIIIEAINKYKNSIDLTYLKDFDGFLNGLIDSYIPRRSWVLDKNNIRHNGWFYDYENRFISDSNLPLKLESSNIAEHIENKRFGYIGA